MGLSPLVNNDANHQGLHHSLVSPTPKPPCQLPPVTFLVVLLLFLGQPALALDSHYLHKKFVCPVLCRVRSALTMTAEGAVGEHRRRAQGLAQMAWNQRLALPVVRREDTQVLAVVCTSIHWLKQWKADSSRVCTPGFHSCVPGLSLHCSLSHK